MTNAVETAQSFGLTGTNAQIVDQLKALGVTRNPIDLAYLLELLNFRGMLRKTDGSGGQERWQGTLQNLKSALVAANQHQKVAAYEMWFSHVTNPRQQKWDTTQPGFAAPFWSMYVNFADLTLGTLEAPLVMPSSTDFQAVAALGGGWKFASLTPEAYAAEVAHVQVDQAYATVQNEIIGPELSATNRTKASIAAKLRDAATALEA